jgi:hypothetical protein
MTNNLCSTYNQQVSNQQTKNNLQLTNYKYIY